MIFALPESLELGKGWGMIVQNFITKGLLSMVAIDNMHCVPNCGTRLFRNCFANILENLFIYLQQPAATLPHCVISHDRNADG